MSRLAAICAIAVFAIPGRAENGVSYLLLDAHGNVLATDWRAVDVAIPVGSLVKPFTAIAYGQLHRMSFPTYRCTGEDCWLKKGHGRVGLASAIAQSCNSYFRELAEEVPPVDVGEIASRFGLSGPPADCDRRTLFGMGRAWRMPPGGIARAYAEIAARRTEPGIAEVVDGMRLSATIGTAAAVGSALSNAAALAKTGTAPCAHVPREPGDGYAVVIYPADIPRYVLLVQVHGKTGRKAAELAASLLRSLAAAR